MLWRSITLLSLFNRTQSVLQMASIQQNELIILQKQFGFFLHRLLILIQNDSTSSCCQCQLKLNRQAGDQEQFQQTSYDRKCITSKQLIEIWHNIHTLQFHLNMIHKSWWVKYYYFWDMEILARTSSQLCFCAHPAHALQLLLEEISHFRRCSTTCAASRERQLPHDVSMAQSKMSHSGCKYCKQSLARNVSTHILEFSCAELGNARDLYK